MLDDLTDSAGMRGVSRACGVSQRPPVRPTLAEGESGGSGGAPLGLVPSAISAQPQNDADSAAHALAVSRRFPSSDLVGAAASLLESARRPGAERGQARHWNSGEAIAWRITVAPGLLRVGTKRVGADVMTMDRRAVEQASAAWLEHDELMATLDLGDDDIAVRTAVPAARTPRQEISEWSARSRSRMVAKIASLDFEPMFCDPSRVPAMVTLTLPGDWQTVASTGRHFKAMIKRWKVAYVRAWGEPLCGIWKLEFQHRGAPHLHVMMTPPHGVSADTGKPFRQWLSESWVHAVNHPDPEERRKHLLAGTGIDFREGMKATDPKRMAVYFTKHSAPTGRVSSKEYQHIVPEIWASAGAGPGRFWGVWGLQPAEVVVEVAPDEAIMAARILRRHSRAQGLTRRVRVWRPHFDSETGELRGNPWRKSTVRAVRMPQGRGFICLNDAPSMLADIARFLDQRRLV